MQVGVRGARELGVNNSKLLYPQPLIPTVLYSFMKIGIK